MVHRQRLDQALTALNNMLTLVRVAKREGIVFNVEHNELFKRAESLMEDEVPPEDEALDGFDEPR